MAISINPVLPVLAAQEAGGVAPELVLQPGSVVNAQVLKVLSADLVRIAIASLSIDVATGSSVAAGPEPAACGHRRPRRRYPPRHGRAGRRCRGSLGDAVTLSPDALADAAVNRPAILSPKSVLTPLERTAVSAAAQAAATEQDSLAPLFANLGAAVSASNLPPKLQAAIAQVLAQQTSLDQNLDGGDIKTAFQKSGIFLEASLAAGSVPASGVPDLKAALIVLRQTLQSALGANAHGRGPGGTGRRHRKLRRHRPPPRALCRRRRSISMSRKSCCRRRGCRSPKTSRYPARPRRSPLAAALDAGPSAGATLNLLQEALQELGNPARAAAPPKDARGADATFHTNTPPPPVRGALPAAQPIASPTIAPDAPLEATAHHLLDDTDAAIARQTLLQVASLAGPHRQFGAEGRHECAALEFRNSVRDAAGHGDGAVRDFPRWRRAGSRGGQADVAGAIFARRRAGRSGSRADLAQGDKTSVRIWAERFATAEQLRAGASELSQALSRAELQPGDIVIRDGAPPQAAPAARAGHFLDRAL